MLATEAPNSTFVMFEPDKNQWRGCAVDRARTRFLPASTFKVAHALIALETKVVHDPAQTVPWDGSPRRVKAWNQDTSLASGMKNSTIWFYQATAKRIGHRRMAEWVSRLRYGNRNVGEQGEITSFWLDGTLRTSAVEQVSFLDRLRRHSLPASQDNQAAVIEMMCFDACNETETASWTLYAKSGAVLPIDPMTGDISREEPVEARLDGDEHVGWFVGWVARPASAGGDRVFALNLELVTATDFGKREKLARLMLEANGVSDIT